MKKFSFILLALAGALAVSCEKNDVKEVSSNPVNLSFTVNSPVFDMDGTKVSLAELGGFSWEGNETASVLVGRDTTYASPTTTKATGLQIALPTGAKPGVFSGTVDLGDFNATDIHGFTVPNAAGAYYFYKSSSKEFRLYIPVPKNQVQTSNGVLNPLNCPFAAKISSDDLKADGEGFKIDDITLVSAVDLVRFNVYGSSEDENLESIEIAASGVITGSAEWIIKGSSETPNTAFNSNGNNMGSVTLSEKCNLNGLTKDNGVKVYMGVILGGSRTISKITVTTDQNTYTKTVNFSLSKKNTNNPTKIYRYGLNLANFTKQVTQYSVDGGATWTDDFPSGTSNTSLAVKIPTGAPISSDLLADIKDWINTQSSPVALDLSACTYESETFPAVFGNSTAANACAKIKSVAWPSNITSIAANAFYNCTGLESVDLTQINTLGNSCLRNTGLTDITVPSNVTSLGTYVLANNSKLASVYWACADPVMANFGTSNRKDYYTLAMANSDTAPTADLVVTIAPDTYIPRYFFRYNNNLKKVIFKPCTTKLRIGNNSFQNVRYLKEIEIQGDNTALFPYGTADVYNANIGAHVATADRKIILTGVTADAAIAQTASSTFYVSGSFFPKLVADLEYTIVGID